MLKYTVYQPSYKHLSTECCNRPNRITIPENRIINCVRTSLGTGGILRCFTEEWVLCTVKTFVPPVIQAKTKGHKTFKSSHNYPEDCVYHSIRDAALAGIACSETSVPVSVCFGSLWVAREQHDHSNTCWRPWALCTILSLKSSWVSGIWTKDVQRGGVTQWNFWCLLEFSSSKVLLSSCTSK